MPCSGVQLLHGPVDLWSTQVSSAGPHRRPPAGPASLPAGSDSRRFLLCTYDGSVASMHRWFRPDLNLRSLSSNSENNRPSQQNPAKMMERLGKKLPALKFRKFSSFSCGKRTQTFFQSELCQLRAGCLQVSPVTSDTSVFSAPPGPSTEQGSWS